MRHIDEDTITQAVIACHAGAGDARLRELMTSLVQHLHAFAREVRLTEDECDAGLRFIAECAHPVDAVHARRELELLSGTLGLSTLVSALARRASSAGHGALRAGNDAAIRPGAGSEPMSLAGGSTSAAADDHHADDRSPPGAEACFVVGHVRGADGRPLAGAELRVWPSGVQDMAREGDGANESAAAARCRSNADGAFVLRCALARPQAVAHDGPVARMLQALGRHRWRPAHLRFMIEAPGHDALALQVFRAGDRYLESDALFGVSSALVAEWVRHAAGRAPDGQHSAAPFHTVDFDFVLAPTTGDKP